MNPPPLSPPLHPFLFNPHLAFPSAFHPCWPTHPSPASSIPTCFSVHHLSALLTLTHPLLASLNAHHPFSIKTKATRTILMARLIAKDCDYDMHAFAICKGGPSRSCEKPLTLACSPPNLSTLWDPTPPPFHLLSTFQPAFPFPPLPPLLAPPHPSLSPLFPPHPSTHACRGVRAEAARSL